MHGSMFGLSYECVAASRAFRIKNELLTEPTLNMHKAYSKNQEQLQCLFISFSMKLIRCLESYGRMSR